MLESIVGFLAKVAFWAFVGGVALGIYLGVRYAPEQAPAAGDDVVCVTPAPGSPPLVGSSG
jgi:hypothetical protein